MPHVDPTSHPPYPVGLRLSGRRVVVVGGGAVAQRRLPGLLDLFRRSERFLGMNVTVPHKVAVIEWVDELDPGARKAGAVNTIVRGPSGRLTGSNTDGAGFLDTLLRAAPGRTGPFLPSVAGLKVLVLGGGGAARAMRVSPRSLDSPGARRCNTGRGG